MNDVKNGMAQVGRKEKNPLKGKGPKKEDELKAISSKNNVNI